MPTYPGALLARQVADAYCRSRGPRLREERLTICANCHRIRDEDGSWLPPATCITDNTGSGCPRGACPDCMRARHGIESE